MSFQVLSVTLDEWEDADIDSMIEVGGNSYANSIYEAFLPQRYKKPRPDASIEERTNFIRYNIFLCYFYKRYNLENCPWIVIKLQEFSSFHGNLWYMNLYPLQLVQISVLQKWENSHLLVGS